MQYLSLFSGGGLGDLGYQHLLGWECLGYLDHDEYCCKILDARISDGFLQDAPVFHCDIADWNKTEYPKAYRGIDCVTAGFPCQLFSGANRHKRKKALNKWPDTWRAIRQVQPTITFMENVPGLLRDVYFGRILKDLAYGGYESKWFLLSAAEVGADIIRKRLWILSGAVGCRWNASEIQPRPYQNGNSQKKGDRKLSVHFNRRVHADKSWAIPKPDDQRAFDDYPDWMDRFAAIGNGQVPRVAAQAYRVLSGEMNVARGIEGS